MTNPGPQRPSDPAPKPLSYRGRLRRQSHDEAHAEADLGAIPPVLAHELVPDNDPALVTTPNDLANLIAELKAAGRFGYDSEFIGEQSYYPRICVIQVATSKRVALVDPLADMDLGPFWELLADESVEKVVHAGRQDLEPVVRHLGKPPRRVFDTQIAAAFVGVVYPTSLGRLVTQFTGADLGKGLDFTQWDHRPLSTVQLRYAANDVRYLMLLRHTLGERLEQAGTAGWAQEECGVLANVGLYQFDPRTYRIRLRGVDMLTPGQSAVLRALVTWREEAARRADVPPRTLVKDVVLLDIVRDRVETLDELSRIKGLPRPVKRNWGDTIITTIDTTLAGPMPPAEPESGPGHRTRIEALWAAIQQRALARGVDPGIVASKKEVSQYVLNHTPGASGAGESRLRRGWRFQLLDGLLDS